MPSNQARSAAKLRRIRTMVIDFACPVCFEPLTKTCETRVAVCGHTLCAGCWRGLPCPLRCPICRVSLIFRPPARNYVLDELLSEVSRLQNARYRDEEVLLKRALRKEEILILKEERAAKKAKKIKKG